MIISRSISLITLSVFLCVAMLGSRVLAFSDLSAEQWAEIDKQGKRAETEQWMMEWRDAVNNPVAPSTEELLALIDEGYGLPTKISSPDQPAGSLRVNFDMNDVIDERDVLSMGLEHTRKTPSMTPTHGSPKGLVL